jgi:hypothetical protein
VLWQLCAVRARYPDARFTLIHHLTFASIHHASFLTLLNVPTDLGRLRGGVTIPYALRKSFPWKYWMAELLRDLHNWSLRADPITRSAFDRALVVFLRPELPRIAMPVWVVTHFAFAA